jgi:NTP pyrophosphatase (non-canonical NTP hydrolase)
MSLESRIKELEEALEDARLAVRELAAHPFNSLQHRAHSNSLSHGFWDPAPDFGTSIALVHTEVTEAFEEWRAGHGFTETYYVGDKPEGVPIELADILIRVFDLAGRYGIDLDKAVAEKMAYNEGRPYRHGGKRA